MEVLRATGCPTAPHCSGGSARITPDIQAIFCRRRHQPRRPPLAKIRPGRPTPTTGPGTALTVTGTEFPNEKPKISLPPYMGCTMSVPGGRALVMNMNALTASPGPGGPRSAVRNVEPLTRSSTEPVMSATPTAVIVTVALQGSPKVMLVAETLKVVVVGIRSAFAGQRFSAKAHPAATSATLSFDFMSSLPSRPTVAPATSMAHRVPPSITLFLDNVSVA